MRNRVFFAVLAIIFAIPFLLLAPSASAATMEAPFYYCETTLENASACDAQIQGQSSPWKASENLHSAPKFDAGSNYVWYAFRLSPKEPEKKAIFFSTTGQSVEVLMDGISIYSYGKNEDVLGNNGSRWHLVPLPITDHNEHWLMVKLYSPVHSMLGRFNYFYLDSEMAQGQRIFFFDGLNIAALSFAIGMLVIMYLFWMEEHISRKIYFASVSFLALFILCIVSFLNMKYLFSGNAGFWWYIQCLMMCLLTMSGDFVIYSVLQGEKKKKVIAFILACYLTLLSFSMLGEILGFHSMGKLFPLVFLSFPVLQPVVLALEAFEGYHGNYYALGTLFPSSALVVTVTFDGMNAYFHFFDMHVYLMPIGIFFFFIFVLCILKEQVRREKDMQVQAENLQKEIDDTNVRATTDKLTGCLNRTSFYELINGACTDAVNKQLPYSLVMFDIDHFKRFNDTYGHDDGDRVLRSFASCIREMLKPGQPLIRFGGEEFIVILPGMNLREASNFAEELRWHIASTKLHEKEHVTSSVGVACWHLFGDTAQDIFRRVDASLYKAKEHGRNLVMTEDAL